MQSLKEKIASFQTAPIRLDAIILRGIGPYLEEARLDIRPLTILCGQNGGGKSTWMKLLRFLSELAEEEEFLGDIPESNLPMVCGAPTLVNQTLSYCSSVYVETETWRVLSENTRTLLTGESVRAVGKVALQASVLRDHTLDAKEVKDGSAIEKLVSNDAIAHVLTAAQGDQIRIEFELESHNDFGVVSTPKDTLFSASLYKNGRRIIFLEESSATIDTGFSSRSNQKNFSFGLADVLTYDEGLEKYKAEGEKRIAFMAVAECMRSWLKAILDSVRIIYANRSTLLDVSFRCSNSDLEKAASRRDVGHYGENSILTERAFAPNNMCEQGLFFGAAIKKPVENQEKAQYDRFEIPPDSATTESEKSKDRHAEEVDTLTADHLKLLHPEEIRAEMECASKLNFITKGDGFRLYSADRYFRHWMQVLLGRNEEGYSNPMDIPPVGMLLNRNHIEGVEFSDAFDGWGPFSEIRYTQGALTWGSPASTLSSGFHHVFPFIVQSAINWIGETFMVESPEAHLHPALQIKLAEFFVLHARTGRQFMLETHSDLIVRRVLRAMIEEELAQDDVRIYFARLIPVLEIPRIAREIDKMEKDDVETLSREKTSILESIKLNDHGQISNWPSGFMDEDVLEARRLMDAMYGAADDEGEEVDE